LLLSASNQYWHFFKIVVNKLGVTRDDAEWKKKSLRQAGKRLPKKRYHNPKYHNTNQGK